MPRPRKLTPEQHAELLESLRLYNEAIEQHGPRALEKRYGIKEETLRTYARSGHNDRQFKRKLRSYRPIQLAEQG